MNKTLLFWIVALTGGLATAQSASPQPSRAWELLKRVGQRYANATSYHIEATEEETSSNELQRHWEKTIFNVTEAANGKYRYEVRSGTGHVLRISDGKELWNYHYDDHLYTVAPDTGQSTAHGTTSAAEVPLINASYIRRGLANLATTYKAAALLADAEVELNGKHVPCYVVRVTHSDATHATADLTFETTIFIRKTDETVLKSITREHGFFGPAHVAMDVELTDTYSVVELERPLPDPLFTFVAPNDARKVDRFPDNYTLAQSLLGKQLPRLDLKLPDGKSLSTESLANKPLLLDVWATWCAPCVEELKTLNDIYQRGKEKLTIITIDQDEDVNSAPALLKTKGYSWVNIHDGGNISNALSGMNGIPRTILANAQGNIVYDKTGFDEQDLREAISGLGAEYAALASKPAAPCQTQTSSK